MVCKKNNNKPIGGHHDEFLKDRQIQQGYKIVILQNLLNVSTYFIVLNIGMLLFQYFAKIKLFSAAHFVKSYTYLEIGEYNETYSESIMLI